MISKKWGTARATDGRIAVIGVFGVAGEENQILKPLWANLPTNVSDTLEKTGGVFNITQLFPAGAQVIRYEGSLTTPPTKEGVQWTVMCPAITMSEAQIKAFVDIIGENARPVQPLNGRALNLYELQ